jgi:uncharacterized membrane protein
MKQLITYFVRGCLAIIPVAATLYILWAVIQATDALLGVSIPGLGLVIAVGVITFAGFLASNVLGRKVFSLFDFAMAKLPVVQLLYTSLRDLIQTFMSETKTVGRPVSVQLIPGSQVRILGLLTRDDLSALNMPDHVAVYVPQAYNIGGQVLAIPRAQIEPIEVRAADMLAFMMSGGASGAAATSKTS